MREQESFLRYHEENPGEIEPRMVTVEYSMFSSSHAYITESCPTCKQNRTVMKHSSPLAIVPKEGSSFFISEDVWRTAGIKTSLEPGTKVELEIGVERQIPSGYQERVTKIKVLQK
ncbi:MAG: hypothetical protein MUP45_04145 [Candidatus Marinimicrobia bacterium]|nr:hypothetical protein [Candidatus Neomarinimicrobiota bacterium]